MSDRVALITGSSRGIGRACALGLASAGAFNLASLSGLVESVGFEILDVSATFPLEAFLLMGDNYVGDDAAGRHLHGKRKKMELVLEAAGLGGLRRTVYSSLARQGTGREVVVYAKRTSDD